MTDMYGFQTVGCEEGIVVKGPWEDSHSWQDQRSQASITGSPNPCMHVFVCCLTTGLLSEKCIER